MHQLINLILSSQFPAYVHFGTDYQTTVTLLPDEGEDYSYFG